MEIKLLKKNERFIFPIFFQMKNWIVNKISSILNKKSSIYFA